MPLKIFISYTQADRQWAEWIAWQVEAAGHEARIQVWDFDLGGNFVIDMDEAAQWADVTMPVLSPDYLRSKYCKVEWAEAFAKDPVGEEGRLIPVRVQDFNVAGLLGQVVYIDLVGLAIDEARARLVTGLQRGRRKPKTEPPFPGGLVDSEPAPRAEPAFPRAVFVGVPHRNPYFTGREGLLGQLHEYLQAARPEALAQAAIQGLGGIGKTQAAIEYVHRFQNHYRCVLWVAAETEAALGASYLRIAQQLRLAEDGAKLEASVAAVKAWLAREDGWLLVFDNADEPARLRGFLPVSRSGGRVLLTSRASTFTAVGLRRPFRLETLEPDEAMRFLLQRTGHDEPAVAAELAEKLGYLPLALEQAAAYIGTVSVRLADYLASFERRGLQLLEKGRPGADYPASVATTWNLSLERVREASAAAAELLNVAAFLDPERIPFEIFTLGGGELGEVLAPALQGVDEDPLILYELLAPLERYSLVERRPDRAFELHRLTQQVVRDALGDAAQAVWAERIVRAVDRAYPEPESTQWATCERLQPSALASIRLIERFDLQSAAVARLLDNSSHFSHLRFGEHAGAKTLQEQALAMRESLLGDDHPDTWTSRNNLGEALWALGDRAEARQLFEQTLEARKRLLPPEHPHTSTSMNNLAATLTALGKHADARELHQQTFTLRQRKLGPEHPDTLTSMNNLALSLKGLGESQTARELFEQARRLLEKNLGPEHPHTTTITKSLAIIAEEDGDCEAVARWLDKLRWLTERDEASIASASQRKIRRYVQEALAKQAG
ncbi:MAG: tetratricopeptide repeat protein [Acidobacteriota bacterium]